MAAGRPVQKAFWLRGDLANRAKDYLRIENQRRDARRGKKITERQFLETAVSKYLDSVAPEAPNKSITR